MKQLKALILRHGDTSLNASNCYRGWTDIPLNSKGKAQAVVAANFLSKYPIKTILCSPLLRAFLTASIVAAKHDVEVTQTRGLLPWNVGFFSGHNRDEHEDALRLFVESPDVVVPGGESLTAFENRSYAFFEHYLNNSEGLVLFVGHTSNVTALVNATEGANKVEPEFGDSVQPGGVAAIYFDGKNHTVETILGKPEEAVFGAS